MKRRLYYVCLVVFVSASCAEIMQSTRRLAHKNANNKTVQCSIVSTKRAEIKLSMSFQRMKKQRSKLINRNFIDVASNDISSNETALHFHSKETGESERVKYSGREVRNKRGLAQLYNMVTCATGCNPILYKGYGCYCGFLGSGVATDSIDRCCMYHDICYSAVNCPMFYAYFMPYAWKCRRGEPICTVDIGSARGDCAADLCECDRKLAMCLSYSPCPTRRSICTSSPLRFLQNVLLY